MKKGVIKIYFKLYHQIGIICFQLPCLVSYRNGCMRTKLKSRLYLQSELKNRKRCCFWLQQFTQTAIKTTLNGYYNK